MVAQKFFDELFEHIDTVLEQSTIRGRELLNELVELHPADIAEFMERLDYKKTQALFMLLPPADRLELFQELSHTLKVKLLEDLTEVDRAYIITHLSVDDLTDFLDDLSDEELEKYLKLLHRKDQKLVLSLLQFNEDSAGGIMHTSVLTLIPDFTVEKSIQILQRLQPQRDLHHIIYLVGRNNQLEGHINLEDLVLKHPKTELRTIMRENELVIDVNEDKQEVAQKMLHYGLTNAPVVDDENLFLGVITSEELVEVIEEEAGEDIYRMSAMSPIEHTYFETPFGTLLYQRSSILIVLLLVQTFSSMIIKHYEVLMCGFLTYFISMLTSTGGNASSQTSALVIQGLATGEINDANSKRFVKREFLMALLIALLLGIFSFIRTYLSYRHFAGSVAVSLSLFVIVLASIVLGSCMPLILKRLNIDPARSAGPLLTTIIDVIGLLIYCVMSSMIYKLLGVV
jgi:magnesium transporter